jgi:hypothetical protein
MMTTCMTLANSCKRPKTSCGATQNSLLLQLSPDWRWPAAESGNLEQMSEPGLDKLPSSKCPALLLPLPPLMCIGFLSKLSTIWTAVGQEATSPNSPQMHPSIVAPFACLNGQRNPYTIVTRAASEGGDCLGRCRRRVAARRQS